MAAKVIKNLKTRDFSILKGFSRRLGCILKKEHMWTKIGRKFRFQVLKSKIVLFHLLQGDHSVNFSNLEGISSKPPDALQLLFKNFVIIFLKGIF